jgi:hypothetical protein
MGLSVKIDSVAKDVEAMVRNDLSPVEQGKAIASFVKEGIQEGDDTNRRVLGRVPPKTITVDGREGASLESVNPDGGQIIIEWELVGDVLVWIGTTLEERSPSISGAYKRGHTLFADGTEVPRFANIPQADEYLFVNLVPYARKIEVGKTKSGRDFVIQVPSRLYERTANDAKARFGNVAKIEFVYQSINGGAVGAWAQSASAQRFAANVRRGNPKLRHEWLTRQPAIIVRLKSV